jgi:hypothetical protein
MADMKILDSVLPFKCDNPDCGKEYDQEKFAKALSFWGFIYLTDDDNEAALVGLTCTKCKKTTLKKYWASIGLEFVFSLWKHLKDNGLIGSSITFGNAWCGKYYSAQHLIESGIIDGPLPNTDSKNTATYSIPQDVTLEEYTKQLNKALPFSLIEEDIPHVLDIENRLGYKSIFRTLPNPGANMADNIDYGIDSILLEPTHEKANAILCGLLKPNYHLYSKIFKENKDYSEFPLVSWQRRELPEEEEKPLLAQNDLGVEEYEGFLTSPLSWQRKSFQDNVEAFLDDLKGIRNRVDCEQIFVNELINKHGRVLYAAPKSLEEARSGLEEWAEMENAESWEEYILGENNVADPSDGIPVRYINGGRLMDKWGVGGHEIIKMIQDKGLVAHDSVRSRIVSSGQTSFKTKWLGHLSMGDKDRQKKMIQRLLFDPSMIAAFEKQYPELANEVKDDTQTEVTIPEKMTPKEAVIECCREQARQLLSDGTCKTITAVLKHTNNCSSCFEGDNEKYKVGERRLRNWLEGLNYDTKGYRRKGT